MDTRGRNRWHLTEPWHNSPLPEGVSHAVTVPPGRGGGRSGGPSGQTRTGTQDGDLQSGTDRQGPWRSWELWKPWRCRELRRPWWSWELWRPWRSWETCPRRLVWGRRLWRPWRCMGAQEAMADGLRGLGPLGPAPTAGTHTTPPKKKISLGKWGGIRAFRG